MDTQYVVVSVGEYTHVYGPLGKREAHNAVKRWSRRHPDLTFLARPIIGSTSNPPVELD